MTPPNRTLIIHAGGHKTGSTALQHYLNLNADNFKKCGIDYKDFHLNTAKANGKFFQLKLKSNPSDNEVLTILENYFDRNNFAICSSEDFELLNAQCWELLITLATTLNIKIHVVFITRDAAPFIISHYNQSIKDQGVTADLMTWSQNNVWLHLDFLRKIEKFTDRIELSVIHYDSHKNQVINKFIELLGLTDKLPPPDPNFLANRSFSKSEGELLLKLNRNLNNSLLTKKIAARLINANPHKKINTQYDPDFLNYISDQFTDDITWINQRFFAGQPIVKIINEAIVQESKKYPSLNDDIEVHEVVLDWAFDQINSLENKSLEMQNAIKDKDLQIAEQNLKIEALLNSTSWKLTAPLRRFADYLRKFKSFLKPQPTKAPSSQN